MTVAGYEFRAGRGHRQRGEVLVGLAHDSLGAGHYFRLTLGALVLYAAWYRA